MKKMHKCYEYQTSIGRFQILEDDGQFHAVYAGIIICSCYRAEEVAAVLGYGHKFSFLGAELGEINTTDLQIPSDLSDWICCFYKPADIRGDFKYNPGSNIQNSG